MANTHPTYPPNVAGSAQPSASGLRVVSRKSLNALQGGKVRKVTPAAKITRSVPPAHAQVVKSNTPEMVPSSLSGGLPLGNKLSKPHENPASESSSLLGTAAIVVNLALLSTIAIVILFSCSRYRRSKYPN